MQLSNRGYFHTATKHPSYLPSRTVLPGSFLLHLKLIQLTPPQTTRSTTESYRQHAKEVTIRQNGYAERNMKLVYKYTCLSLNICVTDIETKGLPCDVTYRGCLMTGTSLDNKIQP